MAGPSLHSRTPWLRGTFPAIMTTPLTGLVAQALAEGLTIVTRDKRFDGYGVPLLTA
jgi:PIN domain nuclease of toxin-antitoxin system